jgi:YaiO family outer membrane protein
MAAMQSPSADRLQAEQLARAGRTVEAIELFKRISDQNPTDIEARLWVARLNLRLGKTDEAEDGFRSVLREHPADVDARIGLGVTLMRRGAADEALAILLDTKPDAGENADLFSALARAYRRTGDDRLALEYFQRARALAPDDPDIVTGLEATALAYGHTIALDGFGEFGNNDSNSASASVEVSLRVSPRVHLQADFRVQKRSGLSDATAGGGIRWRAGRSTTVEFRAIGGSDNASLPNADLSAGVLRYAGIFEIGGGIRRLSFTGVDVVAASPVFAWDGERWRFDGRYTFSRSHFEASNKSAGDHSGLLRETWRGWPRVWLNASYAYGIESFEQLTADRIASLGSSTVASGIRINLPSLSVINATWEHQWRSNGMVIDRFTVSFLRAFP